MRSWPSWMAWLVLSVGWVLPADSQIFPKEMNFQVKSGFAQGSFRINFERDLTGKAPRYFIRLSGFGGLGLTSDQELWSFLLKQDLSLDGHKVVEQGSIIREVFLNDNCRSALGQDKTTCFIYKEREGGSQTQTEIFAPYPAIDLLSSLVVASRHAPEGISAHFNFIFNDSTKQVTLEPGGKETLHLPSGETFETAIWRLTLKDKDFELYRFYIARHGQGYFPAKMVFVDEDQGPIEFTAKSWVW